MREPFTPAAEDHGLCPWMNAPAFGRDVAPLGREVGYHGLCPWGSTYVLSSHQRSLPLSMRRAGCFFFNSLKINGDARRRKVTSKKIRQMSREKNIVKLPF